MTQAVLEQEKVSSLSESWSIPKLGEICLEIERANPTSLFNDLFKYVDITSIDNKQHKIVDPKELPPSQASSRARQVIKSGDVLFSTTRTYLENIALVPEGLDGQIASTAFCVLRPASVIEPNYIYWFVTNKTFINTLTQLQRGNSPPAVSDDDVKNQEIPLAPLNEQKRIVSKIEELFSQLDDGEAALKRAQKLVAPYRQAVLKAAMTGELTQDWREKHNGKLESVETILQRIQRERKGQYQKQLDEWKDALKSWETSGKQGKKPTKPSLPSEIKPISISTLQNLPKLPFGWAYVHTSDVCDVVRGGSPRPAGDSKYYDGNIPFLKVADVTRSPGAYLSSYTYTIKEAGLTKTRLIKPNVLLLSNSGATLGVPIICLIEATFNDGIAAFLGLDEGTLLYHYYFWCTKTKELRGINQGAAQPNLNTDLIKEVIIPICSFEEMQQVVQRIEEKLSVCEQVKTEVQVSLKKIQILRQAILKKAFSGQLVPQDPNDEPALELLNRIAQEREAVSQNGAKPKTRKAKK